MYNIGNQRHFILEKGYNGPGAFPRRLDLRRDGICRAGRGLDRVGSQDLERSPNPRQFTESRFCEVR